MTNGTTVTFTLTLRNRGSVGSGQTVVEDRLPNGLAYVPGSIGWASSTVPAGVTITPDDSQAPRLRWTLSNVPAGATIQLTFKARVAALDGCRSYDFTNVAEVMSQAVADLDSTPGDGQGDDFDQLALQVRRTPCADARLEKRMEPATGVAVGDVVTFRIPVRNPGPGPATGLIVEDRLPPGLQYVPSSIGFDARGTGARITPDDSHLPVLRWRIDRLAPGQEVELFYRAKVIGVDRCHPGDYRNRVRFVGGGWSDPDPGNNEASVEVLGCADLELTKRGTPARVRQGERIRYALVVTNRGPGVARGVQVEDRLPPGLRYVSGSIGFDPDRSQAEGVRSEARPPQLRWTIDRLPPGGRVVLTYTAIGAGCGRLENRAEVTEALTPDPDSTPGDGVGDDAARFWVTVTCTPRGVILGRVYLDKNGDQRYTPGQDEPVQGARVLLSDGTQVRTDVAGRYTFQGLEEGPWLVWLDPEGLPGWPVPTAEAVDGAGFGRRAWVRDIAVIDFPLQQPVVRRRWQLDPVVLGPVRVEKTVAEMGPGRYEVVLVAHADRPVQVSIADVDPTGQKRVFDLGELQGQRRLRYTVQLKDPAAQAQLAPPEIRWKER